MYFKVNTPFKPKKRIWRDFERWKQFFRIEKRSWLLTWSSDVGGDDDEVFGAAHVAVPVESPLGSRRLQAGSIVAEIKFNS